MAGTTPPAASIRPLRPEDVPAVLQLVRDLAEYERAAHEALATEDLFTEALFGDTPAVFGLVVEDDDAPAGIAAFAVWFLNFSTWTGRHGIYLEDLYVRPDVRGRGYGAALLRELASICVQRGYTRLEWSVLDWNEPALGFYRSLGARPMDEWTVHRVAGEALQALASGVTAQRSPG